VHVHALDAMLAYAEQVRADAAITDVVNIGIGGSDLGPQMAVLALEALRTGPANGFTLCPTWTGTNWRRCCKGQAREHPVSDRQQDLHHDRDHDQRALGQSLV
jgi:hypothetical protein